MKSRNILIKCYYLLIVILFLFSCKKNNVGGFHISFIQKIVLFIVSIVLFKKLVVCIDKFIKNVLEERKRNIARKRIAAKNELICNFDMGISEDKFSEIVQNCTKGFKRIKNVNVIKALVACDVISFSGKNDFNFSLNFNDWGYLTGEYEYSDDNENANSNMPTILGDMIKTEILSCYRVNKIKIKKIRNLAKKNEKRISHIY